MEIFGRSKIIFEEDYEKEIRMDMPIGRKKVRVLFRALRRENRGK